jgi:hypothetical protein
MAIVPISCDVSTTLSSRRRLATEATILLHSFYNCSAVPRRRVGTFEPGGDDFAVVGEVDDLGRGWFGFVVKLIERWLVGRLTTLLRWCRVGGDGMLMICSSKCSCADKASLAARNY